MESSKCALQIKVMLFNKCCWATLVSIGVLVENIETRVNNGTTPNPINFCTSWIALSPALDGAGISLYISCDNRLGSK